MTSVLVRARLRPARFLPPAAPITAMTLTTSSVALPVQSATSAFPLNPGQSIFGTYPAAFKIEDTGSVVPATGQTDSAQLFGLGNAAVTTQGSSQPPDEAGLGNGSSAASQLQSPDVAPKPEPKKPAFHSQHGNSGNNPSLISLLGRPQERTENCRRLRV